jgi:ABC-type branched-subunit amino acid transport system substrate-binding protein
MKVRHVVSLPGKAAALLAVLLLACLAAIPLTVACEEAEGPTPSGTPTATVTGTATPAAEVPGISDTEIVLGSDCPLSGGTGAVYSMIPQATGAYFNYINDTQGGVCGRKIVYKIEDNLDDPAKGLEAARKLVEQHKVFALVGSLSDNPHMSAWGYINEKGVPDILLSAGHSMFSADPEGHPWTVQMLPSYRTEGQIFGRYISENLPGKKVAALYVDAPMGEDSLQGLRDGLDPEKNELASTQGVDLKAVSVRSQVVNMHNSGAEVLVIFTGPGFASQAIKDADRLGWDPALILTYISSDDMMFQYVSPELLEGAITLFPFKLAVGRDDPAVARHRDLMQEYGGPSPTNFSVYGQVLAELAVDILGRACDNLTRQGLMDATLSTQDWHSDLMLEGMTISFSETDRTALDTMRMLRATVKDGKGKFEWFGPLYKVE